MGALRKIKTKRRTRYVAFTIGLRGGGERAGILKISRSEFRGKKFEICILTPNRDYDQVIADVDSARHLAQYKASKDPEDLPGLGQHFCVECSKWFESDYNLKAHTKGKNHKRR